MPKIVSQIEELASSGELTAEKLKTDFTDFYESMTKSGELSAEDIVEQFNAIAEASKNSSEPIEEQYNFITHLTESYDKLTEKTKNLVDAYKTLNDGGQISLSQTIALLQQYPDLMKYYDSENGVLRLTTDILIEKI